MVSTNMLIPGPGIKTISPLTIHLPSLPPTAEYNYYLSGLLPSRYYAAFDAQDLSQFKEALWVTAIVVTSVCVVRDVQCAHRIIEMEFSSYVADCRHSQYAWYTLKIPYCLE